MTTLRLDFPGSSGAELSARLDLPTGPVRAIALFAHCFTCSKDLHATRRISENLAVRGIGVLRFDFTGLGGSGGEFSSTNFSSNIADLIAASDYLRANFQAPSVLIGHSLGGAAVLVAANAIPEVKAIATIGAPADANHIIHNFAASVEDIRKHGTAEVTLSGRKFTIAAQFLEDLEGSAVLDHVAQLKKPLLIFHSPIDQTVGIENAGEIFGAARHPKSFISLDRADHLLSDAQDAQCVAATLTAWADRYIGTHAENDQRTDNVTATETGFGKFQNFVQVRNHQLIADEPKSLGGDDSGPTPYDFLATALAACTSMTLRMYADRKGWDISPVSVEVRHKKIHAEDCSECSDERRQAGGKIDRFERSISVKPGLPTEITDRLVEIADKCPVHKTLHQSSTITTRIVD